MNTRSDLFKGQTIMVLDDSKLILAWTTDVLTSAGFDVIALDHFWVTRQIVDANPALILMDVDFASLDEGAVATQALKRHSVARTIPIILHSGKPDQELRAIAARCGADGYICKTDDRDLFTSTVIEFLMTAQPASRPGTQSLS